MARGRIVRLAWVALVLVALDQAAKAAALAWLPPGRPVVIIPQLFDLRLVFNTGAAFSAFARWTYAPWLLLGISLAAVALALWLATGRTGRAKAAQVCLGLIAGGALGNFIDRLRMGRVVDFIDWHLGPLHWPVFNLADAGITVGAVYLGWLILRGRA